MKGTTQSGFEYEIQEETLNDYEFFELLAAVDENPLLLPRFVAKLLGDEQKKKLLDHVRNESGIVPIDKIEKEVLEIIRGNKDLKNS